VENLINDCFSWKLRENGEEILTVEETDAGSGFE
jgi:hypothetical protein